MQPPEKNTADKRKDILKCADFGGTVAEVFELSDLTAIAGLCLVQ